MEDIEILEIDDIIVKKSDNKKEDNVINDKLDNKKDNNKKKNLKKREKLFLIINIIVLLGIIGFYGYRTIYYYKETHNVVENITIKDRLTNLSNITYKDDGLYEKDGYFYYKGINVNNYVYYSGRMFRIIDINNGIRMIEEDIPLKLVWGVDTKALVASLGVIGVVAGLAMQDILKDFLAGFSIIIDNEFDVGDNIQIGTFRGDVIELGMVTLVRFVLFSKAPSPISVTV